MRRIVIVLGVVVVLAACGEGRDEAAIAEAEVDVADQLPFAPTTEHAPSTSTTTTAAPPQPTTTIPSPPTTQAFVAATPAAPSGGCHPSYEPCLPITGDLDCPDIGRQVRVIGPDEYRLDREGDGVGCE